MTENNQQVDHEVLYEVMRGLRSRQGRAGLGISDLLQGYLDMYETVQELEATIATFDERWYLCGHPAWPDPLMIWPPTEEKARESYERNAHPNAWLGRRLEQGRMEVVLPMRGEQS